MDTSSRRLRLGMVQLDVTVGDFAGNHRKMQRVLREARRLNVDLVTFPELAICGYPPEDLLLNPRFIYKNLRYLVKFIQNTVNMNVVTGFVDYGEEEDEIYNAAAIIYCGRHIGTYRKIILPNYGVFDEKRYFTRGDECTVLEVCGVKVGLNICEDIWSEEGLVEAQIREGAEVLLNISASPYHYGKSKERLAQLFELARKKKVVVAYNNMVGGQDELVFDGNSVVVDQRGKIIACGKQFSEDFVVADIVIDAASGRRAQSKKDLAKSSDWFVQSIGVAPFSGYADKPHIDARPMQEYSHEAEIYDALVLGTRDYIEKNGFKKVVLGLSGGIDSALVAVIAVDALGKNSVVGVSMPSRYSSESSVTDAVLLAKNLDIKLISLPIEPLFQTYLDALSVVFGDAKTDTTEENIQARIRGNFVMALSNKYGWVALPTGNKSEMATGYATLYGDMAGGFAILKDVPKTLVYKLVAYRNSKAGYDLVPQSVIDKPPSAELRANQRDTDSLPPYEILDAILKAYVEDGQSAIGMIEAGMDENTVRQVIRLVDKSEYKRRQAPPGIKITTHAFGRDRRLPITNKYDGKI